MILFRITLNEETLMSKINIHPSAKKNFDGKTNELLKFFGEFHQDVAQASTFPSQRPTIKIDSKDIIGEVETTSRNYRGEITERFFDFEGKKIGFNSSNYEKLKKIAEQIWSLPTIVNILSYSFVEKKLFFWLTQKYKRINISDSFIEYLKTEADKAVKQRNLWIPIANLEVEVSFPIANLQIQPLSKTLIDDWQDKWTATNATTEEKEKCLSIFQSKN